LGPDLRLALLAGGGATVARVGGGPSLGLRWGSPLLQRTAAALLADRGVAQKLREAERTYTERRRALLTELERRGIPAHGRSGMNVWGPVSDEDAVGASVGAAGWAVSTGARFRIKSGPAVRITISTLAPGEAA